MLSWLEKEGRSAIAQFIQAHSGEVMAAAIGLEVAALAHIVSDWAWSELH